MVPAVFSIEKQSQPFCENIRPPFFSAESVRFCLERSSIVKVSDEELPTVANLLFGSYTDADTASKAILAAFKNIRLLILTCGAEGAYCYDVASATPCFVPAVKTSVVSSVGAGDSFGATFLVQYFKTKSIPHALDVAAKVSAFVVSKKETVSEAINNFVKDITK